jgi:hypothetical protein
MKRNVLFFVVALIASVALVSCGSEEPQSRRYDIDYTDTESGSNVSFQGGGQHRTGSCACNPYSNCSCNPYSNHITCDGYINNKLASGTCAICGCPEGKHYFE